MHPELPSCADCQTWLYDKDWRPIVRGGKRIARLPGSKLPCRLCPKAKDGGPNPGAELRGRNYRAYQLWLAVRAGLPMPDDALAVANCAAIQQAVDQAERARAAETTELLTKLLLRKG